MEKFTLLSSLRERCGGVGMLRAALPSMIRSTQCKSHSASLQSITNGEPNVITSPIKPLPLPTQATHTLLYQRLQKYRHLDATECSVTGRKYTFGQVLDNGLRWGGLVNKVLPPPSPSSPPRPRIVTFFAKNNAELVSILLGTWCAGAAITTINTSYTKAEVARQIKSSDSGLVVTEPALEGVVGDALALLGYNLPVFVIGASQRGNANVLDVLLDSNIPYCDPVESPEESMAAMFFSSGTTGPPKGVELSHRALTSNLTTFTHPEYFPLQLPEESGEQETVTGVLPFFHIYGFHVVALISLFLANKVVSFPTFDPAAFIRVIKEHKIRTLHLVPPMLNFISMSKAVTSDDLSSVRYAFCAAAPVPATTAKLLKDKVPGPLTFQEGFGMTECLGSHMTPLKEERLGYCGKVIPNNEAKVIDEEGRALPEGKPGELCIRSPSLMTCYHNNPEATASALTSEGWLHTGDVAIHEDGFFKIVDRIKELIKVKTLQVSPSELEDILLQHAGIKDAAVVGVPDDRAGELPRAYVIKTSPDSCKEEDIHRFLQGRVADFKQLRGGVRFVDELPKNPSGKVLRRVLKEMAEKELV